ncbi:MAG: BamA/TamA family outer membrane protein [Chryseolinea sp.]
MRTFSLVVLALALLIAVAPFALCQKKDKPPMFDSLDHKLDMSDFLIEANGFIPVPIIVTEPALGGFGLGVAPVFIKRRLPAVDKKGKPMRIPPDVTGGAALYTVNNSWAALAFRQGTWLKAGSKYRVGGGYANINMKFYRTTLTNAEVSTEFNLRTTPFTGSLLKRFGSSPWSAGIDYTFLNTRVSVDGSTLPEFVRDKEINSRVSMPGLTLEFDNRDNIFTPNKGIRSQVNVSFSDDGFGSDYNYQNLNAFLYGYFQMFDNVVTGLRYEMQQVFGDVPFYLEPYIDLRGVPIARYQANIFSVGEIEVRWDFVPRWSAVGFGGAGKAYDSWGEFKNASWVGSGGAGFRYLIARKFKVRMGLDLARGPEQWAYYIVFGSSWLR